MSTTNEPQQADRTASARAIADPAQPGTAPAQPVADWRGYAFDTRQVHAGEYTDLNAGLRVPPIALSAGYVFDSFDDQVDRFAGRSVWQAGASPIHHESDAFTETPPAPVYSRQGNPTNAVAESRLASLEGGTSAVAVSSGQAAISAALFALAQNGDRIVSTASIYGGTRILFGRSFKRFGIEVEYVWDIDDEAEWERAITPNTKAIYTETIPNPLSDVTDLRRITEIAARYNLPVVVDNTVATPALIRPIEHGCHIVVHSTTKFLTGHGAVVGGAIVDGGNFDWAAASAAGRTYPLITDAPRPGLASMLDRFGPTAYARAAREAVVNDIGPSLSPFNGFLLHQGMETLSLRMRQHVDSAQRIAVWLEQQPEVESVDYSGLPSNPRYELAVRDYGVSGGCGCSGCHCGDGAGAAGGGAAAAAEATRAADSDESHAPSDARTARAAGSRGIDTSRIARTGSVFGVTLRGGIAGARAFIDRLQLFSRMTGIGDTRSMALHPASTTHASFSPELNDRLGVTPGLVRLSVGLEDVDDLIHDLRGALDRVAAL